MKLLGAVVLVTVLLGCGSKNGPPTMDDAAPLGAADSSAPSGNLTAPEPAAPAAPAATSGEFQFVATIVGTTNTGGPVIQVHADPRFILSVHIDSVEPNGQAHLRAGDTHSFGVHSLSKMFPGGLAIGQRSRFSVKWDSSSGSTRMSALRPIR